MMTNPHRLQQFEHRLIKQTPPDYYTNLKIVEALFQEATTLGIFPLSNPLDGIEVDIHYAKVINVRTASG